MPEMLPLLVIIAGVCLLIDVFMRGVNAVLFAKIWRVQIERRDLETERAFRQYADSTSREDGLAQTLDEVRLALGAADGQDIRDVARACRAVQEDHRSARFILGAEHDETLAHRSATIVQEAQTAREVAAREAAAAEDRRALTAAMVRSTSVPTLDLNPEAKKP